MNECRCDVLIRVEMQADVCASAENQAICPVAPCRSTLNCETNLFLVIDESRWLQISIQNIPHACTLGTIRTTLYWCVHILSFTLCPICACVCVKHSFKDTIHSSSYSPHFPRDKVPISPSPAVRKKDGR